VERQQPQLPFPTDQLPQALPPDAANEAAMLLALLLLHLATPTVKKKADDDPDR
jgi:hypothetical protein